MRSLTVAALLCASQAHAVGDCLSPDEIELAALVNAYRVQNGLSALPVSRWLSATGQWKTWDRLNNPSAYTNGCSTHSWSNNPPVAVWWTGVCWTGSQSVEMWRKPREISVNRYTGNGFELTADAPGQTAANALAQWQASPAHNTVILQQGVWSGVTFRGIGTGLAGSYAVLWFGDALDTDVAMLPCSTDNIFANGLES